MSLVVIREGTRQFTRDRKLRRWEIFSPMYPGPVGTTPVWRAQSYGYTRQGPVTVLGGATLDGLLTEIERYAASHSFKFHEDDAESAVLAGGFGALVGGAIAAGAALLGARTVARLALLKALGGVGLLGGGLYLGHVIDRERRADSE